MAFGVVLCVGAVTVVALAAFMQNDFGDAGLGIFAGIWGLALASGLVASRVRVRSVGGSSSSSLSVGGPATQAAARSLAVRSIGLPLFGIAMMGPLSLHAFVVTALQEPLVGFQVWILGSAIIVGHAHIALGLYGMRFARDLVDTPPFERKFTPAGRGAMGASVAMLVSLIPGAVAMMIPPMIVWITGLMIAPAAFAIVAREYEREQIALRLV